LKTVYYEITTACICRCPHCHIPVLLRHKAPLIREYSDIVADLSILKERLSVENVVFSGGEPTLHKDIKDIIDYASEMFNVSIISNGVSPALLRELNGKAKVWVSIDYYGSKQDKWRGYSGLFENYLAISDIANVRITLLKDNLHDLEKLIELAVGKKRSCTVVPYKGTNTELTPSPSTLNALLEKIFQNGWQENVVVDDPCIRFWLLQAYPELTRKYRICNALTDVIRVTPEGTVTPCPFLDNPVTNIRDENLKEKLIEARKEIERITPAKCRTCIHRDKCGGCKASTMEYCFLHKERV